MSDSGEPKPNTSPSQPTASSPLPPENDNTQQKQRTASPEALQSPGGWILVSRELSIINL